MIWAKFKVFFLKNLENSQAFINDIWNKLKKDFLYQHKKVQD